MTPRSASAGHTLTYAARLGWGIALMAAPGAVLAAFRADDDGRARAVLRILGARHVVQSLLAGRRPGATAAVIAAAVDATHAVTAAAFAALDPARRRIALTDAAVAATWTAVDAQIIRNS